MVFFERAATRCFQLSCCVMFGAIVAPSFLQPVHAQDTLATTSTGSINVNAREAKTIRLPAPAAKVFVASPSIADVDASKPMNVVVYGRSPGHTSIIVTLADGSEKKWQVTVTRAMEPIQKALRAAIPTGQFQLTDAPQGLVVSGSVPNPSDAARAEAIVSSFMAKDDQVTYDLRITSSMQVLLQVRVAEVSKTASNYLGFNWGLNALSGGTRLGFSTGRALVGDGIITPPSNAFGSLGLSYSKGLGNTSLTAVLDALKEESLVSILAEPNLTAISGASASFLAGGEIPVPMVNGRTDVASTTIDWKPFGIRVDFTPTVIDERRINIKVYSEVSEVSRVGGVSIAGTAVPGLSVRKIETTVELGSGESFAIAGLFKNNLSSGMRGLPFLSDIPVLGALFRSQAFARDESELVIMITPYVVKPVSQPSDIRLPTDDLKFRNPLEKLLSGRRTSIGEEPRLQGPSGFMLEEPR